VNPSLTSGLAISVRRAFKAPLEHLLPGFLGAGRFRSGDGGIRGRKIAILTAAGVDAGSVARMHGTLTKADAVVRLVAARLGILDMVDNNALEPDATLETLPSVLFDAVIVADGEDAADQLGSLMLGAGERVLEKAGLLLMTARIGRWCAASPPSPTL
jgi:hypothetical protein